MTAKTSSIASTRNAPGNNPTPWNFLADLGRQQLAMMAESTSAMYRGREALRAIQQQTAHEASIRHAEAAKKLLAPCEPADMLAIQSELLRSDLQCAAQYWQQLAAAMLNAPIEMMASVSHTLDGEADGGVKAALKAFQAAIPPMANSFFVIRPDGADEQQRDA